MNVYAKGEKMHLSCMPDPRYSRSMTAVHPRLVFCAKESGR